MDQTALSQTRAKSDGAAVTGASGANAGVTPAAGAVKGLAFAEEPVCDSCSS